MGESSQSRAQVTLASDSRVRLLAELQRAHPQTSDQLAARLGLHRNTVREHLARLSSTGFVISEREQRTERGRPKVLFSPAEGLSGENPTAGEQTRSALALGRAYRSAFPDATPTDRREQLDVLDDHLDRCGFQPRMNADGTTVRLICPFADLFEDMDVELCRVHLRLIRSVLARVPGELEADGLAPAGADGSCVLHLRSAACPPRALPEARPAHP